MVKILRKAADMTLMALITIVAGPGLLLAWPLVLLLRHVNTEAQS